MCSLGVTAKSPAGLGMVLAGGGIHPVTGERLLDADVVRVVKTIMLDLRDVRRFGEFAVHVGNSVEERCRRRNSSSSRKKMGIGIYGPALDQKGNSIAGGFMLRYLSDSRDRITFAEESI